MSQLVPLLISARKALYPEREPQTASEASEDTDLDAALSRVTATLLESHKKDPVRKKTINKPFLLKKIIKAHTGWVRALCISPENTWFALGGADSAVRVFDLALGTRLVTLTGHVMLVRDIKVLARHPYLFLALEDKLAKCWDLEKNAVVRDYYGHLSSIYTLALHPTLDLLVTGSRDSLVRLWDVRTRAPVHVMTGHEGNVWLVQARPTEPQIISAGQDCTVRTWDLVAGKGRAVLLGHSRGVRALAMSSEEGLFVLAGRGEVLKWAVRGSERLEGQFEGVGGVNSMSLSGGELFIGGAIEGGEAEGGIWDYYTGEKLQTIKGDIYSSCFDRSGDRLMVGGEGVIEVWGR